jgi:hypothetical protein
MSLVTNALVMFSICEKTDEGSCWAVFNDLVATEPTSGGQRFVLLNDLSHESPQVYGGSKCLEQHVAVAALNFVSRRQLAEMMAKAPWEYPDDAQLLVCEQEDSRFSEVNWRVKP